MKLSQEQRQRLGEALSQKLPDLAPPDEFGRPDWFDCRLIDEVIDTVEGALTDPARAREAEVKAVIEVKAREIYEGWKHLQGWVPWVEGGNSLKQTEARRQARTALQASPAPEVLKRTTPGWGDFSALLTSLRSDNALDEATYRTLHNAGRSLAMTAWSQGADVMADAVEKTLGGPEHG